MTLFHGSLEIDCRSNLCALVPSVRPYEYSVPLRCLIAAFHGVSYRWLGAAGAVVRHETCLWRGVLDIYIKYASCGGDGGKNAKIVADSGRQWLVVA